jgi:hypothetical protein
MEHKDTKTVKKNSLRTQKQGWVSPWGLKEAERGEAMGWRCMQVSNTLYQSRSNAVNNCGVSTSAADDRGTQSRIISIPQMCTTALTCATWMWKAPSPNTSWPASGEYLAAGLGSRTLPQTCEGEDESGATRSIDTCVALGTTACDVGCCASPRPSSSRPHVASCCPAAATGRPVRLHAAPFELHHTIPALQSPRLAPPNQGSPPRPSPWPP